MFTHHELTDRDRFCMQDVICCTSNMICLQFVIVGLLQSYYGFVLLLLCTASFPGKMARNSVNQLLVSLGLVYMYVRSFSNGCLVIYVASCIQLYFGSVLLEPLK